MSGHAIHAGRMNRSNLEVFADTVEKLAENDARLLVVTSDSRGSGKLGGFAARHPERMVEVGIAEQNLVGVAAGLAATGRTVFAVSPASFLCTRSLEQIKHDVCYSDRPVVLVGISAGVSYGALGSTHHSLHDYAALRAMPNVTIVAPADNWEAREAVKAAAAAPGPVYIRFGKRALPDLPHKRPFRFGEARIIREGEDAAIVACGETVWRAMGAAQALAHEGVETTIVSCHTVRPLDEDLICSVASSIPVLVVAEEHSCHGGLGEACAAALLRAGIAPSFEIAALPDEETLTGSQEQILDHYGISPEGLADRVLSLIGRQ